MAASASAAAEPLLTPKLAAVGMLGGITSGLLGVGGGILIVPLLVYWAGYRQRDAHAWSLGAIIPIALAGLVVYGAAGEVQLAEAGLLAGGALLGALAGARALTRLPERTLKLLFAGFLLTMAVVIAVGG